MTIDQGYDLTGKRIWVTGHRGMVGAALVRRLEREGCEVLTTDRAETDLKRQTDVEGWISRNAPHAIFMAAGTVGGILANDSRPADFLYDNLIMQANIAEAAWQAKVEKVMLLGSSCIYPKLAPQPITEDALLTGPLEPTNEWYAVAKIAGVKLAQAYRRQHGADFIAAMPTNLYGPGDNFDLESSHVAPALMRKAHEAAAAGAKSLTIWGSGTPRREFLHVDDCADALVLLMTAYSDELHVNVGTGEDVTILELARTICDVVGFGGEIVCDISKPDGTPRKLLDVSRLRGLGWAPRHGLRDGLSQTYDWYLSSTAC
jgi:GDP-L-fucose synthase